MDIGTCGLELIWNLVRQMADCLPADIGGGFDIYIQFLLDLTTDYLVQ